MKRRVFRRLAALVLACLVLLGGTALADRGVGGEGWFDDSYLGSYVVINNSGAVVKVPSEWKDISFVPDMQMYQDYTSGEGGMYFYLSTGGNDVWDGWYDTYLSGGGYYQESAAIILQQDRDWLILTDDSGMVAVTSINGVSIVFEFQLYQDSDWTWARRIVSSVRTN